MKYTYLLIDFFTLLFPLLFSFRPKMSFYKTWKAFFPAAVVAAAIFIMWDMYFTRLGVWGFNPKYVTGLYIGNLPLEEVLFFLCIPYACVFSFFCFGTVLKAEISVCNLKLLTVLVLMISITIVIIYITRWYTSTTFVMFAVLHILAVYVFKVKWLPGFYLVYCFLLIPFAIVNGLLTGTWLSEPVVWYNRSEIIGPRLLTIPVEDIFYGMDLILLNLLIYVPLSLKINSGKALSPVTSG